MKINYSIPEDVLEKVDIRAKELGISRSAFITMTLSQALMQNDFINQLPKMLAMVDKTMENDRQ